MELQKGARGRGEKNGEIARRRGVKIEERERENILKNKSMAYE